MRSILLAPKFYPCPPVGPRTGRIPKNNLSDGAALAGEIYFPGFPSFGDKAPYRYVDATAIGEGNYDLLELDPTLFNPDLYSNSCSGDTSNDGHSGF